MDPITLITSIIPLITGRFADARQLAEAERIAIRLIRMELRINASIIDCVIPNTAAKTTLKLTDVVAIEIIKHLSTDYARALLGGIGVPSLVVTGLDAKTRNLINKDKLPVQIKTSKKGSPVSLTLLDLLDYLIRKDKEMKALSAIAPIAGKSICSPDWTVRLKNFQTVSIAAITALPKD